MDPLKFKKVEEIYHAALEFPASERSSFIEKSCEGDVELKKEVESLLSFETPFDSRIDNPPESLAADVVFTKKDNDLIGKRINQYEVISLLGRGGMGEVYLARDTKLERKVAIKFLSPEFAEDPDRLRRFFQEAKAASALNHPNIITVYEIGETDGKHFIVTEFIEGKSLSRYLSETKPALPDTLNIATQVASALSAAHETGIVHRDIKPDNVMIRPDRLVKVLDFGLAKLTAKGDGGGIDSEGATRAKVTTVPGMVFGTPQYMSPEQARGQKADLRSDIFSFGVMLYEMISGDVPFKGVNELDTIGSILKDRPTPLGELIPEVPVQLEHIVNKSLRKDRDQRYQHTKDLLIDLNDVKKTAELDAHDIATGSGRIPAANSGIRPKNTADPLDSPNTVARPIQNTIENASGIIKMRRFSMIHALGFLLIAAIGFGGVWWFFLRSSSTQSPSDLKNVEIATWASTPGETTTLATFSPDGKMIAFSSTKSGTRNIWIKQSATGEPVQITKDEFRNENPVWSPSGEEIAYFSSRGSEPGIWRVPALGGSPKLITGLEDGSSRLKFWGKSGLIYFEVNNQLFSANPETGETKSLGLLAKEGESASWINISQNEQKLAFTRNDGEKWQLFVKAIQSGEAEKVFEANSPIRNIVWHPDNRRIFFSSMVDSNFQIFVIDASGSSQPRQITSLDLDSVVLDISSDGKRILYGTAKEESDIWQASITDKKTQAITSDINSEMWPDVSPDGKTIVFQSIRNLNQANKLDKGSIISLPINTGVEPLTLFAGGNLPKWSPDGSQMAFMTRAGLQHKIEIVNSTGGDRKVVAENVSGLSYSVLPYHRAHSSELAWSPDGKKIVYISPIERAHKLSLANTDGSGTETLAETGKPGDSFEYPMWSPTGNSIAFVYRASVEQGKSGYTVKTLDAATKGVKDIYTQPGYVRLVGWGQDGKELIIASVTSAPYENLHKELSLGRVDVTTNKLTPIVTLKEVYLYNIYLSPDKKTIAFTSNQDRKDNLWVISVQGGEPKVITDNNDPRFYFSSLAWAPDSSAVYFGKQSRYTVLSMLTNFE